MSHEPHILKQHEFEDLKMQLGLILRAILSISENRDVNDQIEQLYQEVKAIKSLIFTLWCFQLVGIFSFILWMTKGQIYDLLHHR
jgi:nitrate reductase NapE component